MPAARSASRTRKYDAIVSQPSHPWTAGASHLYTLEFMQQARAHLTDGGVFVQWMNVTFVDEALLRSLAATLLHGVRARSDLSAGSQHAGLPRLDCSAQSRERLWRPRECRSPTRRVHYARVGINTVEDLVAALAADEDGAARARGRRAAHHGRRQPHGHVQRVRPAAGPYAGRHGPRARAATIRCSRQTAGSIATIATRLSFDYIARRQTCSSPSTRASIDRLDRDGGRARDETRRVCGPHRCAQRARRALTAHAQLAREALALFPDDQALRYAFLSPWLGAALARHRFARNRCSGARLSGSACCAHPRRPLHCTRTTCKAVAALDPLLARIPLDRPWKFDAVQARADWRGASRRRPAQARRRRMHRAASTRRSSCSPLSHSTKTAPAARSRPDATDVLVESLWYFGQGTYLTACG